MTHSIFLIAIVVRDYDEAIAFYTQKLGFTLVREVGVAIAAPGECGIQCEWRLRRPTEAPSWAVP